MRRTAILFNVSFIAELCFGFQVLRRPGATTTRFIYSPRPSSLLRSTEELPEMENLPSMDPFSHELETEQVDDAIIRDDINMSSTTVDDNLPLAPPLTFNKFLTMQDKRVVVTIRYTDSCGIKPYYLTAAKKIKASHPDVVIEKRILPALAGGEGMGDNVAFEILVDDKLVVGGGSQKSRRQRGGVDAGGDGGKSIYVSMQEMDLAIAKARRKRRPTTLYGADDTASAAAGAEMRLEMLRNSRQEEKTTEKGISKWND